MAKSPNTTTPAPTPGNDQVKAWVPPTSDQEFEFTGIADAPGWVDKNWAGFDRGPALALPAGDLYGEGPYHTKFAHIGDKVMFIAGNGITAPRFEVIPHVVGPKERIGTRKPPQASPASLEDLLKGGFLGADDLGDDAKAEIAGRSPRLKSIIEGEQEIAEPQQVGNIIKTD